MWRTEWSITSLTGLMWYSAGLESMGLGGMWRARVRAVCAMCIMAAQWLPSVCTPPVLALRLRHAPLAIL